MTHTKENVACCPEVDVDKWDKKTHVWKDKLFIKETIPLFFHIPSPKKITEVVNGLWEKAKAAGADTEIEDFILLATDVSKWKGVYYMNVTKEVEGVENIKLSGTFVTQVFDGPYNKVPKYIREIDRYLEESGKKAKNYYFYYTTCPKCAKKYGHNYIIAFTEISTS